MLFEVIKAGGTPFLVGGSIRDLFLLSNQRWTELDLDIEVHNLSLAKLEEILKEFAPTIITGKQFAVLKMPSKKIDWAVPRIDSVGRKPEIRIIPNLSITQALLRRDITINSMALNLEQLLSRWDLIIKLAKKYDFRLLVNRKKIFIEDPFDGLKDLKKKIINPTSKEKFIEDPLRLFRVMQFLSRFNFKTSIDMDEVARKMSVNTTNREEDFFIAKERITEEFLKMLQKSKSILRGLFWLKKVEKLEKLSPGLASLSRLQKKRIIMGCDYIKKFNLGLNAFLVVFLNEFDGEINKMGNFIFNHNEISRAIFLLKEIKQWPQNIKNEEIKFLAKRIFPVSLEDFFMILLSMNKISKKQHRCLKKTAKSLGVYLNPISPLISGEDLLQYYSAGPDIGFALKKAYELQIKHNIKDKKLLFRFLLSGHCWDIDIL